VTPGHKDLKVVSNALLDHFFPCVKFSATGAIVFSSILGHLIAPIIVTSPLTFSSPHINTDRSGATFLTESRLKSALFKSSIAAGSTLKIDKNENSMHTGFPQHSKSQVGNPPSA
jgi:hypothetical protein